MELSSASVWCIPINAVRYTRAKMSQDASGSWAWNSYGDTSTFELKHVRNQKKKVKGLMITAVASAASASSR